MPFNLSWPWWRRKAPAHIALLMGAAGLALTIGVSTLIGWSEYQRRFAEARQATQTEAYFLSDHASRLFEGAQVALQTATAVIDGLEWDDVEASPALHQQLRSLSVALPYIDNVWLADETGLLRATNFEFPAPVSNASDRESFQAARAPGKSIFVGPRIVGRVTGKPTFQVSQRLENADGSFHGMVAVTASLNYFDDYWRQVTLAPGTRIELYRVNDDSSRREVLAAFPQPAAGEADAKFGQGEMFASEDNFISTRSVGNFPIFLSVSVPHAVVIADWWRWFSVYGPLTGVAILGLGFLTALALRQARIDDAARSALLAINQDLTLEMRAREQAEQQVRQLQKIEALGQLTGGIAHDFNNLLTVIIGNADVLVSEGADRPLLLRSAQMVVRAAERGAELTSRLLAFSRRQPLNPHSVDVNGLIRTLETMLKQSIGEEVDLQMVSAAGLWAASVDPGQLEAAILNLAINARDAMPQGGKLTIETANASIDDAYAADHAEVQPGQYVLVAVSDTGTGMSEEVALRAFEPFFTTKPAGRGSGLGLSMVYGFVKQSGGHIKIYSERSSGTTVKLYLPRSTEPAIVQQEVKRQSSPLIGTERLLVVEDDLDVLAFTTDALRQCGYDVVAATRAAEALKRIDEGELFDLLFTDIVLPDGVNGRQLADLAVKRLPALKVLFTSGYTENAIIHHGRLDRNVQLLSKPFRKHDLAMKIRRVLDS